MKPPQDPFCTYGTKPIVLANSFLPQYPACSAGADKADLVKAELQKLVEVTLAAHGCTQYGLHQNDEDPAHFMIYEN